MIVAAELTLIRDIRQHCHARSSASGSEVHSGAADLGWYTAFMNG